MRYFQDTGLLILYSFLALFFIDPGSHFIFALLCTLILMCCCYVFEHRTLRIFFFIIYGLLTFPFTELLLFYPVFVYTVLYSRIWLFLLWAAGICCFIFKGIVFPSICLYALLFGSLLAFFLERNTSKYEKLELSQFYSG